MTLPGHAPNPDDPNDEDQLFQYASVEPSAWTSSALGLWISARWIRERDAALHSARGLRDLPYRPRSEELMLRGMAVECQLKAVLFARRHFEGPFTLADRDALGRWFRSHDLRRLAKEAGVGPTDDELRVLGMLAAFVRWAGRYPAPISQGEGWALPRWRVPDDDDAFDGLWNRIEGAAPRASRADEGAGGDGPARPSGSTDA